ncbi:MAG TPA: hypothetical protein VH252_02510 [Chthoniobacterales bacterium]|jgi:hypothetical protein|nr:hypothetical protein [Chthoniobacterales bacterium]
MRAIRAIAITGLIVGAMDITSAFILAISRGSTVTRLLQFVASGLIGPKAFEGGTATALLGLGLHFVIAFSLVAVFYAASRSIGSIPRHAVISGLIYGLIVFGVMNLIVLPLSAAKPRHSLTGDLIQIGIHLFIIGLPTALLIRRFSGATRS